MKKTIVGLFILIAAFGCCGNRSYVGNLVEPLEESLWENSEWISVAAAPIVVGEVKSESNYRAADGANWFVREISNEKKVVSAKWMTTGLGVYELYVNGKIVGEEVLKPGFTHPEKTKISYTYDVTEAFNCGKGVKNTISAQVTPGWWADKIVTKGGHEGMTGHKCAFRGVLELTYADGSKETFGTDTDNWKAGIAGPVKHAAIFDGEEYDARIPEGWKTPEKLGSPLISTEFNGRIVPTDGAEIYRRNDLAMDPVRAYIWEGTSGSSEEAYGRVIIEKELVPGRPFELDEGETLVIDFGQNCAGVPEFVFKADGGTVLTCLPGELLNDGNGAFGRGMDGPEGSVHRRNLRTPEDCFRIDYTFAEGERYVRYSPRCTFFGYRYLSITATDDVEFKSIISVPVSSISESMETGKVKTGNSLVNRLISNTIWGQRSNYLSVTTDCPQRNERLGWTADTQVFTETGTFFADTRRFFHKWTRDLRDTQAPNGGFSGVAPAAQYGSGERESMRLGWSDAGVIVPWTIWKQFGDKEIVEENWDAMEKFIDHVNATKYDYRTNIKENGYYQWADWLSYEPLESCSGRAHFADAQGVRHPLPETVSYWNYLSACYWAIDASMMADMAEATGRDKAKYETMNETAKAYIREKFIGDDGFFKTDILNTMQTPALFALKVGVVDGVAREGIIERLRKNFEDHGNCLQTGFLGTSILMGTLTDNGMSDIAYELLFQRKNPSWLYSVDNGATTIWERWNSYTIEKGMGPAGMNSFNHYAYGCVCQWIWETAAGIAADPAAPGFRHIIMKPIPDKRLGSIEAEYNSAAGLIKSAWKYEGDSWTWTFTIPEGSSASVTLPGESLAKEYGPGTYTVVN